MHTGTRGPTSEEEVPFGGLLSLLQTGVEETQELKDPLFSARLCQTGVIHNQVWVDLAIVSTDVETSCCRVVFLNNLHSRHEPREQSKVAEIKSQHDSSD